MTLPGGRAREIGNGEQTLFRGKNKTKKEGKERRKELKVQENMKTLRFSQETQVHFLKEGVSEYLILEKKMYIPFAQRQES